jgi:threonine synthase
MQPSPLHDRGVIARYRNFLPVTDATPVISLNEGSTPLIHSPKLSAQVGRGCEVYIKYEGLNPTSSFKDRGMTCGDLRKRSRKARAR